jgi:hypothetical protein
MKLGLKHLYTCELAVSQFTLYGTLKGNKPDFHVAMAPDKAKPFYASLVDSFRKSYKPDAIKGEIFHVNFACLFHRFRLDMQLIRLKLHLQSYHQTEPNCMFDLLMASFGLCYLCRWCFWSNDEGKCLLLPPCVLSCSSFQFLVC